MKTYHIVVIGCQMNKSDSERIASYLEDYGYTWSDHKYRADLVVITTCGVRQSAEDRIYGMIPRIKKENPGVKIILTGCLSQRKDVQRRLNKKNRVDIWLPIVELPSLAEKLEIEKQKDYELDYLKIKSKINSKFSAFVPIGNGCNNFCTYCVVPYARGREVYRSMEDILAEARDLVSQGYKEIILIAQNVNSYKSGDMNFAQLLRAVNEIEGDFWIRFSTSHPKDMSDDVITAIAECDRVCEHIHLPAQAGNNEILRLMNRKYTIEHYRDLIEKIKKNIPDAAFTTDIIVGFPSETEEQFGDTVKLFEDIYYDMAYIGQYSPRPGTVAEKMDDNITKEEKKRREEVLMDILRRTSFENNKKYIGKIVDVLVEVKGENGEWFGKGRSGKVVKIKNAGQSIESVGRFVKVKIEEVKDFGLEGSVA